MELAPCSRCGRHVRVAARACPFCDEVLAASATHVFVGRVTRATVFAAALAGGCWTERAASPEPPLRERIDRLPAGTIAGVVRDFDTKRPLAGYTVSVLLPDGTTKQARSNDRGEYRLEQLPPGSYEVQYANAVRPRFGVRVTLDDRVGATVELPVYRIDQQPMATPYGAPPALRRRV